MVAARPENAKNALSLLDRDEAEEGEGMMTEQEIEEYVPIQMRPGGAEAVLRELQTLGFAIMDDGED